MAFGVKMTFLRPFTNAKSQQCNAKLSSQGISNFAVKDQLDRYANHAIIMLFFGGVNMLDQLIRLAQNALILYFNT